MWFTGKLPNACAPEAGSLIRQRWHNRRRITPSPTNACSLPQSVMRCQAWGTASPVICGTSYVLREIIYLWHPTLCQIATHLRIHFSFHKLPRDIEWFSLLSVLKGPHRGADYTIPRGSKHYRIINKYVHMRVHCKHPGKWVKSSVDTTADWQVQPWLPGPLKRKMPLLGLPASASYQLGATTGSSKLQFQGSYCPCKRRCKQHKQQNCLVNYTEVCTSSQPAHDSSSALSKYQSHTLRQQLGSFPCLCLMPDFFLLPSLFLCFSLSPPLSSHFSFFLITRVKHEHILQLKSE